MATKVIGNEALLKRLARNGVYASSSPTAYKYNVRELRPYLSEEAFIWYKGSVEAGLADTFADREIFPRSYAKEIARAAELVSAEQVYKLEAITNHDIIALVNAIKALMMVPNEAKSAAHRAATSFDIIDTANGLRYRDAFNDVILPDLRKLMKAWIKTVREESGTLQIGRTHLQHAEPVTFGFAMAWFVDRLGGRILKLEEATNALVGKFAGAVGAYNAPSIFVPDPAQFERDVLGKVRMKPAGISTQIIQQEFVTDLVHFSISTVGVIANWADDMRNLMRPEIAEIGLPRGVDVSRSSTMPNKANPVGYENAKSLWKVLAPKMMTMYMDQISENQRDLTNSASQRYTAEIFEIFGYVVQRATRIASGMKVNRHNMLRNFGLNKNITSEPLQLILAQLGMENAHEAIGKLADRALETGKGVMELAEGDPELAPFMKRMTEEQKEILNDPKKYTGIASAKALEIADKWERILKNMNRAE